MSRWLNIMKITVRIPEIIKTRVEDARDVATSLGIDMLGLVEISDGGERYYVIRQDDFEEWFGE